MTPYILFLPFLFILAGCSPGNAPPGAVITWAVGKDVTGTQRKLADDFMAQNPGCRIRTIEMPESATTQRDSYVTNFIARDPTVDVYSIDITWAAEFAAAGWLLPLDEFFPLAERHNFIPGPIEGCTYRGHIYAVPWFTDAGILYYRRDLLDREGLAPPQTWEELAGQAAYLGRRYRMKGFVYQAAQYEGLVCNFFEFVWSFGGTVDAPGRGITLDTPEARQALQFMHDTIYASRITGPEVLSFKEEESRMAFTSGDSVFLRNWPYVWTAAQDRSTSQVQGKIGITALPGKNPGGGVSCLGGWNLALSRFSRNPRLAWRFIAFMTGRDAQRRFALSGGRLPTRQAVYRDEAVLAAQPHLERLYPVFVAARPRPVSPYYSRVSDVLQVELHRALTGRASVDEALKAAQKKIDAMTK